MGITKGEKKLNGTVIVTYRCNARCTMCNRYKAPSRPEEEISIETIRKLPRMYFTNITGGEPFIREDLPDIVRELYKKSDRIVISTNGFFTDRILALAKEFPQIGIRISIEGLEETNNAIRGLQNGYQRGYQTLKKLREMGMKDVGFGMTVQDRNAPDLVPLYKISEEMGMEFATASLHNSFYFVEAKNIIHDRPMVAKHFEDLVNELLRSNSPKKWFRAYFNHGLINYIYGQKRLLPCDMSFDTFFIDPYGDVMPCNGTKDKEVMGNLNTQTWEELWNSPEAEAVRRKVRNCDRECWMIGSVSPAMHKYIWVPALWVMTHKLKALFTKHPYSMYELKVVRDYRDGRVTKEELDRCSTCDLCAEVNNGLSEASKEQLEGRSGEEIVDADIASQRMAAEEAADDLLLQKVQKAETEALAVLKKICNENKIRFYLRGGSVLGAVKYRGFVPWDDDIDIALPRKDYEKLIQVMPEYFGEGDRFRFVAYQKTKDAHCYFPRVLLNEDERKAEGFPKNNERGLVLIDVLPLDGMPGNPLSMKLHIAKAYFYRMLASLWTLDVKDTVSMHGGKKDKILRILHGLGIHRLYTQDSIYRRLDRMYGKYPFGKTRKAGTMASSKLQKEIMPTSWFGKGCRASFNGIPCRIPTAYDAYLKQLFGENYASTEPPVSERTKSHLYGRN